MATFSGALLSADDTGISFLDGVTSATSPRLSGLVAANATVSFMVDGIAYSSTADATGRWTKALSAVTHDGTYAPVATVTASNGSSLGTFTLRSFTLDHIPPVEIDPAHFVTDGTEGIDPASGGVATINNLPTYSGSVNGATSVDLVILDDSTSGQVVFRQYFATPVNNAWSITVPETEPLPDGQYTVSVSYNDQAGNRLDTVSTLIIDNGVPAGSVAALAAGSLQDTGLSDTDGITQQSSPTLNGTTEPFLQVLVEMGPQSLTTQADADGHWTVTFLNLPDGEYTPVVTITDLAGNVADSTDGQTIIIDTQAATDASLVVTSDEVNDTGVAPDDGITSNRVPELTGQTEPGAQVVVNVNGVNYSATADDDGAWVLALSTPLPDGTYTPNVTVTDLAGNSASFLGTTFSVDGTAPAVDGVHGQLTSDVTNDSGHSTTDGITNNASAELNGTAAPGTTVLVEVDGTEYQASADNLGLWQVQLDGLSDGTYEPIIRLMDVAGNVTQAVAGTSFTVDTSAPEDLAVSLAPQDDTGLDQGDLVTMNTRPTLQGTTEAFATVELDIGGILQDVQADAQGQWQIKLAQDLADGEYVARVASTDLAGNRADWVEMDTALVIDTHAPTVATSTLTSDEDNDTGLATDDGITANRTPELSGETEAGALVSIHINGADYSTTADDSGLWAVSVSTALPDGTYVPVISVTDLAGNVASFNGAAFSIDATAPATGGVQGQLMADATNDSGSSASDGVTNNASAIVHGTAPMGATVLVEVDGTEYQTVADVSGAWQIQVDGLGDGIYQPTIRLVDVAGNVSDAVSGYAFTVDTAAPEDLAATLAPIDDTGLDNTDRITQQVRPTLEGTTEAFATVDLEVGGIAQTVQADAQGQWQIKLNADLADGEYVARLAITDVAGNRADWVELDPFTIDSVISSASGSLSHDASNDTGRLQNDSLTYNNLPVLTGQAEAGAQVVLQIAGQSFQTEADDSGHWEVSLENELADGRYTAQGQVTDLAGNTAQFSLDAFTVDTVGDLPLGQRGTNVLVKVGTQIDINAKALVGVTGDFHIEDLGGSLPSGLHIDATTGHIVGKATVTGFSFIGVTTQDDAGNEATAHFQIGVFAKELTGGSKTITTIDEEKAVSIAGSAKADRVSINSSLGDVVHAESGNDLVTITKTDGMGFSRIDGGQGLDDRMVFSLHNESIDLSDFNNPDGNGQVIEHIEAFQFTGKSNDIHITAEDILHLASDTFDGARHLVRIMASTGRGTHAELEELTKVGPSDGFNADGSLSTNRTGDKYSKFIGVVHEGGDDHLVELLLQKGIAYS
jgi:Fe2+ transport system protein FeoA